MKRLFPFLLCFVVLSFAVLTACSKSQSPEKMFAENLYPYVDTAVNAVVSDFPLSDLTYEIRINEIQSETSADGEIIFISNELENYSPEEQYAITQEIARLVFLNLSDGSESLFMIKMGDWRFTLSHGVGYSVWRTNSGANYISSYYSLEKNGVEIYDNPLNDLESEIESALGMPYNEWVNKQKRTSEAVSPSDKDFWLAVAAAQKLVKDKLQSPLTARFPVSADSYSVNRKGDKWEVAGYVDAQNGFGATVREKWIAKFTMGDTSGSQYKISNSVVTFE